MTNVVNLDDYRECELLGTVNVYRQPNGAIVLGVSYMDERQIESVESMSERFDLVRLWLTRGMPSLEQQAKDFEE